MVAVQLTRRRKQLAMKALLAALASGTVTAELVVVLVPGAESQTALGATPEQVVAYLDRDGDGKVGLQDYLHFQQPRLAQFDADGDGILSEREFRESLQGDGKRNAARSFRAFNNEDQRKGLTQREFLGYHAYVFNNFVDANKDGFMSADEWAQVTGR